MWNSIYLLCATGPSQLVDVNLVFAISANSMDSDRTFLQMQEIMKSVVDTYPTSNIFYSVLSFGDSPVVHLDFTDQLSDENIKRTIDSIGQTTGSSSLDKALDKARDLLDAAATERPGAKNILVVMVDSKSDSDMIDVKVSSRLLRGDGVKVMVVGVGNEVDQEETGSITYITILTNTTDRPEGVAKEIIRNIDKGKNEAGLRSILYSFEISLCER